MRFFLFLFCCLLGISASHAHDNFSEYPDLFQIRQDRALRLFHIQADQQFLGTVVSSDYGVFDFYNSKKEKEWVNEQDVLYDSSGNCVGLIEFELYNHSFHENLVYHYDKIEIYSDAKQLLVTLDSEISDFGYVKKFFFRDADNQEILATGQWEVKRASDNTRRPYPLQDWSVNILDRQGLLEKKISPTFLVWALLKHSQRYFPSCRRCPMEREYGENIQTQESDPISEPSSLLGEFPDDRKRHV